jgi:C_GCAxxG_C_C family probable redox protein
MTNPIQTAQDLFAQGFNCSQAVFSAFAPDLGIQTDLALKLASPFGGGIARQGDVCGAVIGALLVLGLQKGNSTVEAKDETYRLAENFIQRFRERHGAVLCRELIGHDISTSEGLQSAREQRVFVALCPAFVQSAVELIAEQVNN